MDVCMDFAINASADHPWLKEHPEWFHRRPDGTLKYAENPPKRYQDIYNVNWESEDWRGLWDEWRRIFLFWVEVGVKFFRVDNPHTKPFKFWEWLIAEVHRSTATSSSWPRRSPAARSCASWPSSASPSPTRTSPGRTRAGS